MASRPRAIIFRLMTSKEIGDKLSSLLRMCSDVCFLYSDLHGTRAFVCHKRLKEQIKMSSAKQNENDRENEDKFYVSMY